MNIKNEFSNEVQIFKKKRSVYLGWDRWKALRSIKSSKDVNIHFDNGRINTKKRLGITNFFYENKYKICWWCKCIYLNFNFNFLYLLQDKKWELAVNRINSRPLFLATQYSKSRSTRCFIRRMTTLKLYNNTTRKINL
jgi:hypothetical protein